MGGTLVRVLESHRLQAGRFFLSICGVRRFRVVRTYHVDGYTSAQVVWIEDDPLDGDDVCSALVLGRELEAMLPTWIEQVRRGWERRQGQMSQLLDELGSMP